MLRSWLCYVAIVIGLAIFSIMYTKECAVVMFFVAVFVPVLYGITTMLIARKKISVFFGTKVLTMTREKASQIEVIIQNDSEFTSGCMVEVCLAIRSGMGGYIKKYRKKVAIQTGKNVLTFEYQPKVSGLSEIYMERVRVYGGFSLFYTKVKLEESLTFLVMPKFKEYAICQSLSFSEREGESPQFSSLRSGNDPSELYDIREYQRGDKLNRIHWKFSAKNSKMMVQDFGFSLACDTMLLLDVSGEKNVNKIETILEKFYYLVVHLTVENHIFYVVWKDERNHSLVRRMITKEEDIFTLFYDLFQSYMAEDTMAIEDMYEAQFEGEYMMQSVLFCVGRKQKELEIIRRKLSSNSLELVMG